MEMSKWWNLFLRRTEKLRKMIALNLGMEIIVSLMVMIRCGQESRKEKQN